MQWNRTDMTRAVIAVLTLGLLAVPAAAQNLDLDEVGAALALPVITGADPSATASMGSTTEIVITNAGNAVRLHITLIDGFDWSAVDFSCDVTKNETTLFIFRPPSSAGGGGIITNSELTYECLDENGDSKVFRDVPVDIVNGIMFVSIEDPSTGQTINTNQVFGDFTVIDYSAGTAYSAGAIPFQGKSITTGVADRDFRFDNVEYSAFPSKLASNFIAPETMTGMQEIDGELILFSLDGTVGAFGFGPVASVSVKFYNDDEMQFSSSHTFPCFDIVRLEDIDSRFEKSALGSPAGHLVLTPQVATQFDLAHDASFDPGPMNVIGVRKAPVHGWLVQTAFSGASIGYPPEDPAFPGMPQVLTGEAAWARTLAQSQTALVPHSGDVPTLRAP